MPCLLQLAPGCISDPKPFPTAASHAAWEVRAASGAFSAFLGSPFVPIKNRDYIKQKPYQLEVLYLHKT